MLTLFTTPVVYLYLDRFGAWIRGASARKSSPSASGQPDSPISLPGAA